jgi:hypothetical protein
MPIPVLTMTDQYLISLQVQYEPDATDVQRSLSWLAPELIHAGLTATEDTSDLRTWDGVIDGDTFAWIADAWDLGDGGHAYTFDGTEFEPEGWSPIVWVKLTVEVDAVEQPGRAAA